MMLVFFCISLWILTFLALQIRVGIIGRVDFFGNDGYMKVSIFGIKVFTAHLRFEHDADRHNNIIVEHGKKAGEIHLNNDPKDKKSIARMLKNPSLANMLMLRLSAHFTVGKANDSFFTAMLLGGIRTVFFALSAFIKCRQKVEISESFTPDTRNDLLEMNFSGIICISLADIIYSLFIDKIRKIKLKSQEVQRA